jgi:hypothetical protein
MSRKKPAFPESLFRILNSANKAPPYNKKQFSVIVQQKLWFVKGLKRKCKKL